jgi:hypothetical protein
MGWLYLSQDVLSVYGLAVFKSGYGYEDMGCMYVCQNMGLNVLPGCI